MVAKRVGTLLHNVHQNFSLPRADARAIDGQFGAFLGVVRSV